MTVRMSCVIVSKMNCIKYCYVDFLLKIYLAYTFIFTKDLRFELRCDLTDLGFKEKWRLEIWLNALNTFLERSEV